MEVGTVDGTILGAVLGADDGLLEGTELDGMEVGTVDGTILGAVLGDDDDGWLEGADVGVSVPSIVATMESTPKP